MEETSLRNRREDEKSIRSIQSKEPKTTSLQKEVRLVPGHRPFPGQGQQGGAPVKSPLICVVKHISK